MSEENSQESFSSIRAFEWDEKKRERNLTKHGIDFDDARAVFDGPILFKQSRRGTETRYVVLGFVRAIEIAVICTFREDRCRIISARRARTNERKELHRRIKRSGESG
jgi:uncharacterized DUF497 family protein